VSPSWPRNFSALKEGTKRGATWLHFIEAARLDEPSVGQGTVVTIASKDSLGSSPFDGSVVTCRFHGWRYNVTTGNTLHVPDYGRRTR
jgi:hypothetical protein